MYKTENRLSFKNTKMQCEHERSKKEERIEVEKMKFFKITNKLSRICNKLHRDGIFVLAISFFFSGDNNFTEILTVVFKSSVTM